jgi:hypothetical protein
MTATTTPSAYPRTVNELIEPARDLADRLGKVPSRNTLMKTFKIGGPKAKELIAALTPAPAAPTAPESVPSAEPTPAAETPAVEPVEPTVTPPVLPEISPDPVNPPVDDDRRREMEDWIRARLKAGNLAARTTVNEQSTPPLMAPIDPADEVTWVGVTRPPVEPSRTAEPDASPEAAPKRRRPIVWPVLILCLPAFVAIWGGWVEMGRLTGFGMVTLLPGFSDFQINTAITLPIGVETYAAYALYVWLSGLVNATARTFAKWSALASLLLGALGQVGYHLMAAAGWTSAPWPITAAVSCIPVAVLGMGAGLAHLMHRSQ